MKKYTSPGFRSVTADSMTDAALLFANREARRRYGRAAYARTCTQQSHASDMSFAEYAAFIGIRSGPSETTGSQYLFSVYED